MRRNAYSLAVANISVGVAFIAADPGVSASLHFLQYIAPLPVWGAGHLGTAVLLVARRPVAGHTLAVPLWLMWAVGAVFGLVTGTSRSPAASIALAGLITAVAGLHCSGWSFRRSEADEAAVSDRELSARSDVKRPTDAQGRLRSRLPCGHLWRRQSRRQ